MESIEFTIQKENLLNVLNLLHPFIIPQDKEGEEFYEEDDKNKTITLSAPYFEDKLTFVLYESYARIFTLTEGVKVERTCILSSNVSGASFCMPFEYLLQEVNRSETNNLHFVEDRFFGFIVDNGESGHLFDIDAHSVRLQPKVRPDHFHTLYPKTVGIKHDVFLTVLKYFPKYTNNDILRKALNSIWFFIDNGTCRVIATNGHTMRVEVFQTKETYSYVFNIPGKYAVRILDIVQNWNDYTSQQVGYNDKYCMIQNNYRNENYEDTIEWPIIKECLPNVSKVLDRKNIIHKSMINFEELRKAFKMVKAMDYYDDFIIMHFIEHHLNIYSRDSINNRKSFHFFDVVDNDGNYVLKLHLKRLEEILNEVDSENVMLTLVDNSLLYINKEDEHVFGPIIRILGIAELKEDDKLLLEEGDQSMLNHKQYIAKYYSTK